MGKQNLKTKKNNFERYSFDIGYGWFWALDLSPSMLPLRLSPQACPPACPMSPACRTSSKT